MRTGRPAGLAIVSGSIAALLVFTGGCANSMAALAECGTYPVPYDAIEASMHDQCVARLNERLADERAFQERVEEDRLQAERQRELDRELGRGEFAPLPEPTPEQIAQWEADRAAKERARAEAAALRARAKEHPGIGWLNGHWCEGGRQKARLELESVERIDWFNENLQPYWIDKASRQLTFEGNEFETYHEQDRGFFMRQRFRRESDDSFSLLWVVAAMEHTDQRGAPTGQPLETWHRCDP